MKSACMKQQKRNIFACVAFFTFSLTFSACTFAVPSSIKNEVSNKAQITQARANKHNNDPRFPDSASQKKYETFAKLLDSRADINGVDNTGQTALAILIGQGQWTWVEWLLDHGADPEAPDASGRVPLWHIDQNSLFLISFGMPEKPPEKPPLPEKLPEKLAKTINNQNGMGNTLLQWAIRFQLSPEKLTLIDWLIHQGTDLSLTDERGNTALHLAAESGHLEVIKLLIHSGARTDIQNQDGFTPFQLAIENGHPETFDYLYKPGTEQPDYQGYKSFMKAVEKNDFSTVEKLLDLGYKANSYLENKTPMHLAKSIKMFDLLLSHGADVNASADMGYSPLRISISPGVEGNELTEYLLKHGANPNSADFIEYQTPLHVAIKRKNLLAIKLLQEYHADFYVKDILGRTPLHLALESGQIDIIQYVFEQKLNLSVLDYAGISALGYALISENEETWQWLQSHIPESRLISEAQNLSDHSYLSRVSDPVWIQRLKNLIAKPVPDETNPR